MSSETTPSQKAGPPPSPDEFPAGIALVTAAAGDRRNLTAANRLVAVAPEPMIFALAVARDRYTHGLIKESGEFVINCITKDLARIGLRAGMESGRDVDKFAAYGLETRPASVVKAPLIVGCACNIECHVIDSIEVVDRTLFIAKQVALHVDEGKAPLVSFKHRFFELSGPVLSPP